MGNDPMDYASNVWRIRQEVKGGGEFSGSAPSRNGDEVDPEDDNDTNWDFTDLDDGGEFDFEVDKSIREVKRIWLDVGDADSWRLDIVTFDADGDESVHTVLDDSDYASGATEIDEHGRALFVLDKKDVLRLHTTNSTERKFASIMTSYW